MTRPLILFLAGVVLPVILAVAGAVLLREEEARNLQEDATARIARITGALFLREAALGSGTPPSAPSLDDPGAPSQARARAVLRAVERWAGYHTAVYLDGARTWASDPQFGPDRLPAAVVEAVRTGEQPAVPGGEIEQAAVVGLPGGDGTASLAILAAPLVPRSASLPLSNLLPVLTVAVILSVVAAWVLFQAPAATEMEEGRQRPGRMQTALVVLIPILAGWALLGYLRRDLERVGEEMTRRELSRTVALVRNRIPDVPVEEIQAVTGFDATRIEGGRVMETTVESAGLSAGLAQSPSPPAGLTSSGRVQADGSRAVYLALRQPGSGVLMLTTPDPDPRVRLHSTLLWFLSVVIALPGGAALLGGRLVSFPPPKARTAPAPDENGA